MHYLMSIETLVVVSNLVMISVAVTFGFITWNLPARDRSMVLWASGFILRMLGLIGISLRDRIPDLISMPLANTLIVACTVLLLSGVSDFTGRGPRLRSALIVTTLVFFEFFCLYLFNTRQHYNACVVSISVILAGLDFLIVGICIHKPEPRLRLAQYLTAFFFLLDGGVYLVRAAVAIAGPHLHGLFEESLASHIGFAEPVFMPICVGLGFGAMIANRAFADKEKLIAQLEEALANVKALSGLLPICSSCKKIRDDQGYWHQVEAYLLKHSEAEFSHGICPDCIKRLYPGYHPEIENNE